MHKLVPDSFKVPEIYKLPELTIRKLTFDDAVLDLEAVLSSMDIIHKTRGGSWPEPGLNLKEDQIDLAWHQREFENRTSFAYTIMSPDETRCLGCLYFYQPGFRTDKSKDADVDVSFWVIQDEYDKGLYPKLYRIIKEWLEKDWPFKNIYFSNIEIPE